MNPGRELCRHSNSKCMKPLYRNRLTLVCLALLLWSWSGQAAASVELSPGQVVLRNEHYR